MPHAYTDSARESDPLPDSSPIGPYVSHDEAVTAALQDADDSRA